MTEKPSDQNKEVKIEKEKLDNLFFNGNTEITHKPAPESAGAFFIKSTDNSKNS